GRDLGRLQAMAERFAPARDALVGDELDHHGAAPGHPAHRECEWLLERGREHMGLDRGDLHGPGTRVRQAGPADGDSRVVARDCPEAGGELKGPGTGGSAPAAELPTGPRIRL